MRERDVSRRRWLAAALLAATLLTAALPLRAAELRLLTEEYPPLSFLRNGRLDGLAVEIVTELQRRVGSTSPIELMPWARAYQVARYEPDVALFSTARTAEREAMFRWVGPLFIGKTSLYARRGSTLRLHSLADASAVDAVIVPREDYKHQLLKAAGLSNLQLVNTHEQMVRMLLMGRGTLMAANNLTLPALLAGANAGMQDVQRVLTFQETAAYIAFSPTTAEATVQRWQAAWATMRDDGTLVRIQARWLPDDTVP